MTFYKIASVRHPREVLTIGKHNVAGIRSCGEGVWRIEPPLDSHSHGYNKLHTITYHGPNPKHKGLALHLDGPISGSRIFARQKKDCENQKWSITPAESNEYSRNYHVTVTLCREEFRMGTETFSGEWDDCDYDALALLKEPHIVEKEWHITKVDE